jgi:hypothetical protein
VQQKVKVTSEAIRNLRRPEVREAPKKKCWDWTRCKPLLVAMAIMALLAYLKWAEFVR